MYQLNTALPGFTVGRKYEAITEHSTSIALKNDLGEIKNVAKRFLVEAA